jgi:hypothetical protein
MILTSIDTHIVNRLKKIKVNSQNPTVFGPGDARTFGETTFPCFSVSRISPLQVDMERYNHFLDVFTADDTEGSYIVPDEGVYQEWIADNGQTIGGTTSWTRRKIQIPVFIDYQVDVLATTITHRDYLELGLVEALPAFYRATVEGQDIILRKDGDAILLDDVDAPLFRTAHRYNVSNIWLQRTPNFEDLSITDITMQQEAVEEIEEEE